MKKNFLIFFTGLCVSPIFSQTIGTFNSVQPTAQTQNLVLPSSHIFQQIIRSGDGLPAGGTLGDLLDFTGYVPIAGSSTNGYLSISSETIPASCAILSVALNGGTNMWSVSVGGDVLFPTADLGSVSRFCAGTVTPGNHIMVCEEDTTVVDVNADGYNDRGWIIEIDPATRTVINQDGNGGVDKLWALGRQVHEDIAISADQSVAYWSADNIAQGYVYKFVPTVPGNFSDGSLYVLNTTSGLGTGTWLPVSNSTISERNNTTALSSAAGGYNFNRVEGIEIGPDGRVYFPSTTSGAIYRFRDLGTSVDQLEIFVDPVSYDVDGAGPYPPEPWGTGADNIAFDGEGNLWVLQDGDRNHIWVVGPDHTAAAPNVRLFATTPAGSEPTGITFSPDYKYLFMSIQHPANNTTPQMDAEGNPVVFNRSTAIVIARRENIGPGALPLELISFKVLQKMDDVELLWETAVAENYSYEIHRSFDGTNFTSIGNLQQMGKSFLFVDKNVPVAQQLFYRIKLNDKDGTYHYSGIKSIRMQHQQGNLNLNLSPFGTTLNLEYNTSTNGKAVVSIINSAGSVLLRQVNYMKYGKNFLTIDINTLSDGTYYVVLGKGKEKDVLGFIKR